MNSRRYGIWVLALAGLAAPGWAQQRDMTVPPMEYHLAFGPYYEGEYKTALDGVSVGRPRRNSQHGGTLGRLDLLSHDDWRMLLPDGRHRQSVGPVQFGA